MKDLRYLVLLMFVGCISIQSPEEKSAQAERYQKSQESVTNWIKYNALYPESYKSVSFSEYSESISYRFGAPIQGTTNYFLRHVHEILDKDSVVKTFSGYFILEDNYSVNIIETQKSNSLGGAFPPRVNIWLEKFGRPRTEQDSIDLAQKEKETIGRIINDLKKAKEEGNLYPKDAGAVDKIIKQLDTLKQNGK